MPLNTYNEHDNSIMEVEEGEEENTNDATRDGIKVDDHINSETKEMAASLKTRATNFWIWF